MPLTWRETLYPASDVSLEVVASQLAGRIASRGIVGAPASPGDTPGEASSQATSVRFTASFSAWSAAEGSVELSGSPDRVVADYSVPLPTGRFAGATVFALAATAWLAETVFGDPFGPGLASGILWVLGGMYVMLRVSLKWRMLDLLKEAVAAARAPAV